MCANARSIWDLILSERSVDPGPKQSRISWTASYLLCCRDPATARMMQTSRKVMHALASEFHNPTEMVWVGKVLHNHMNSKARAAPQIAGTRG